MDNTDSPSGVNTLQPQDTKKQHERSDEMLREQEVPLLHRDKPTYDFRHVYGESRDATDCTDDPRYRQQTDQEEVKQALSIPPLVQKPISDLETPVVSNKKTSGIIQILERHLSEKKTKLDSTPISQEDIALADVVASQESASPPSPPSSSLPSPPVASHSNDLYQRRKPKFEAKDLIAVKAYLRSAQFDNDTSASLPSSTKLDNISEELIPIPGDDDEKEETPNLESSTSGIEKYGKISKVVSFDDDEVKESTPAQLMDSSAVMATKSSEITERCEDAVDANLADDAFQEEGGPKWIALTKVEEEYDQSSSEMELFAISPAVSYDEGDVAEVLQSSLANRKEDDDLMGNIAQLKSVISDLRKEIAYEKCDFLMTKFMLDVKLGELNDDVKFLSKKKYELTRKMLAIQIAQLREI